MRLSFRLPLQLNEDLVKARGQSINIPFQVVPSYFTLYKNKSYNTTKVWILLFYGEVENIGFSKTFTIIFIHEMQTSCLWLTNENWPRFSPSQPEILKRKITEKNTRICELHWTFAFSNKFQLFGISYRPFTQLYTMFTICFGKCFVILWRH